MFKSATVIFSFLLFVISSEFNSFVFVPNCDDLVLLKLGLNSADKHLLCLDAASDLE